MVWERVFSKSITQKDALALLVGEEITLKGLKGKSGKLFSAVLRYDHEAGRVVVVRFL